MLLAQVLLPRFLVLEGLLFVHLVRNAGAYGHSWFLSASGKDKSVALGHRPRLLLEGLAFLDLVRNAGACGSSWFRSSSSKDKNIAGCSVALSDDDPSPDHLPLFYSASQGAFLLPVGVERKLHLTRTNDVTVECPGARVLSTGVRSSTFGCLDPPSSHNLFNLSGDKVSFTDVSCSRSIRETVVTTKLPCGPADASGRISHISWAVGNTGSKLKLPQVTVCHDEPAAHTHYVNHTIYGPNLVAAQDGPRLSYFKEGGFFDTVSAERMYRQSSQEANFKALLGDEIGGQMLDPAQSYYLARGHLAPDADFVWKEWQDATYYFINVAPQWQSFNNGNWKAVEAAVREYAKNSGADLAVYTGTLGQLAYENGQGRNVKIFLGSGLLPVPEFLWKLVHNPVLDQAIVFVGLNDPHRQGDLNIEASICPDKCAQAEWFFLYQSDVTRGFLYCCSYQDFRGVIDWTPDIGDPGLLQNILTVD